MRFFLQFKILLLVRLLVLSIGWNIYWFCFICSWISESNVFLKMDWKKVKLNGLLI